jgi:acetyl/propionyl-CoA carboxylase alpha subunit
VLRKVLIANRGEIAVRIIRACREMGLGTAAVYSEADEGALHVLVADEAIRLGPADPHASYLHIGRLIDAARRVGADAVHPGYGFLAESPAFAAAVRGAGLAFIGPPADVIARVGDKVEARRLAERAGVPVIPGFAEAGATDRALAAAARRLGLPVLIKAAAGGGGRGMRIVERDADLPEALAAARREARGAFGSGEVFLEHPLPEVRHVEVQILADHAGTVWTIGERECSIQRRHQKIIEESPSPAVTPEMRSRLAEAASAIAREAGYVNAGTVEFLVDPEGRFYFLEVNARLQVEHPVTEATTGVDLVHAQIRIASGEPLEGEAGEMRGHAIECRIYAEDPGRDFRPTPGLIQVLEEPRGPGVRVDSGLREGWRVPVAYDPLLAKVVAWDRTRAGAISRMAAALQSYVILGCGTNLVFLQEIIGHEAFRGGETTTRFLERHFPEWRPAVPELALAVAAALEVLRKERPDLLSLRAGPGALGGDHSLRSGRGDPWDRIGPWRLGAGRA